MVHLVAGSTHHVSNLLVAFQGGHWTFVVDPSTSGVTDSWSDGLVRSAGINEKDLWARRPTDCPSGTQVAARAVSPRGRNACRGRGCGSAENRSISAEAVIPVGHRVSMSIDEPHAAVLRHHDHDGIRHGIAKAIRGAMPCPDGVDELHHERVGFEIHCASHFGNRRKGARDFSPEAEDLEAFRGASRRRGGGSRTGNASFWAKYTCREGPLRRRSRRPTGEFRYLLENETGMHSCLDRKPKLAGWRRRQEEASP
jgi:hypothetical protein